MSKIVRIGGIAAIALAAVLLMPSCGSLYGRRSPAGVHYPKMYEERPMSVLIMPQSTRRTKVEAKGAICATLYIPLVSKGYYVFSPTLIGTSAR